MADNSSHYCMCLTQGDLSPEDQARLRQHRTAVLKGARWQVGASISVRFLDGDPTLQARVRAVAMGWIQVANLMFDFRKLGPTDIRIAFTPGGGSWSYMGTLCRQIAEPKPTMNYG
jgi:hypothetical protein